MNVRRLFFLLIVSLSFITLSFAQEKKIKMKTVQKSGEMSFGLATSSDQTISIDWGDGVLKEYQAKTTYQEFKDVVKGPYITITGDLTNLNAVANKLIEIDLSQAPSLEILMLAFNFLSKIDISPCVNLKNFEIFNNQIKDLDLTKNKKLIRVVCSSNFLQSINVSQCPELEYFDCSKMGQVKSVDLTNNHKLKNLIITKCGFSELRLSPKAPIKELLCEANLFTKLDLRKYKTLSELNCSDNKKLSELLVEGSELTMLYSMGTNLPKIDLKNCSKLKYLMLKDNLRIRSLDENIYTTLEELGITGCSFSKLIFPKADKLVRVWCTRNNVAEVDISKCPSLELLDLRNNNLNKLDLPKGNKIKTLLIAKNGFEAIDLTNGGELRTLDLGLNNIKKLDLSACKYLATLNLRGNPIKDIDLSALKDLSLLGLVDCKLSACEYNKIYEQLPKLPRKKKGINLYNGTKKDLEALKSATYIVEAKNWKVAVEGDASGCPNAVKEIEKSSPFKLLISQNGQMRVLSNSANALLKILSIEGKVLAVYPIVEEEFFIERALQSGVFIVEYSDFKEKKTYVQKIVIP